MSPLHILILERDPVRAEELLGLLRAAGHRAAAAPDAPAAAMAVGGDATHKVSASVTTRIRILITISPF